MSCIVSGVERNYGQWGPGSQATLTDECVTTEIEGPHPIFFNCVKAMHGEKMREKSSKRSMSTNPRQTAKHRQCNHQNSEWMGMSRREKTGKEERERKHNQLFCIQDTTTKGTCQWVQTCSSCPSENERRQIACFRDGKLFQLQALKRLTSPHKPGGCRQSE